MRNAFPKSLRRGDKVCLISTARKVSRMEIIPCVDILKSWGLEVLLGKSLYESDNQFAGKDNDRLSDIQAAMDDPEVRAIFCARGGYGTPRIVDDIKWELFLHHPKWIIGFSDVTVLLNSAHNKGVCSLHAPMSLFFDKPEYQISIEALRSVLFGERHTIYSVPDSLNKLGKANGVLVGGNLSLVVNSIGTKSAFDPMGKILFLEDIDEYLYHVDRMMVHLKRAGVLEKLSGLVVGHFSDMKDNAVSFGETAYQIIARNVAEYSFPVAFGLPLGHEPQNMPVVVGANYCLDVAGSGVALEIS